ncbi:asparagine synthase [Novosphingobium sp. Rr 2-17]|uniref:asparagine synthase-related protein n=1 Tax=Novosphingobium sp. Rr 2-17 TaxID=555793 RepID=UPI0002698BF4|nr:asparagine synthetase B family protein [Novosphingobium sp. Rr 2-17]EIZ78130.1 asparagine synthase [Novosphingobium sp. Rr 2-17]
MRVRFAVGIDLTEDGQAALRYQAGEDGDTIYLDGPGLFVAAPPYVRTVRLGKIGIVLGALFSRNGDRPVTALAPETIEEIVRNSGRCLIERYWGDYVAVFRLARDVAVLRSPFGHLACLYRGWAGGTVAASDIDRLERATKIPNTVAFDEVARQLIVGDMRSSKTSLTDVYEVRGGEVACLSRKIRTHVALWSPWSIACDAGTSHHTDAEGSRFRDIAVACVAAKTHGIAKPLVLLSGGLDSSIVTACLANRGRDFACLNLIAPASAGDERMYARAVAEHIGRKLFERPMPEKALEFGALAAVRLPRPVARSFEQRLYLDAQAIANELGCDGVIDGGGGDNVFCSLQSASPAADCLLDPTGRRAFWHTCHELAALTHASVWQIAWKALRRAATRARPYRWAMNERMLSADAVALPHDPPLHPWLTMGTPGMPGRAAQIAMLVAAQSFVEDGPHGAKTQVVSPLVSQPLIEHCLSIPSWQWFDQGCNRAVARHAFAPWLPRHVVWRRGKGIPDSFIVQLFETNRASIREHLIDGWLARAGVIDVPSVLTALDDPNPFGSKDFSRIVRLMDTEVWVRGIMGR